MAINKNSKTIQKLKPETGPVFISSPSEEGALEGRFPVL
jgi:hypothetical protein